MHERVCRQGTSGMVQGITFPQCCWVGSEEASQAQQHNVPPWMLAVRSLLAGQQRGDRYSELMGFIRKRPPTR